MVADLIIVFLVIASLEWVFLNKLRPVIAKENIFNTPRIEQYFKQRKWIMGHFVGAVNFIKSGDYDNIGLYYAKSEWEYPFWVLLNEGREKKVRIEHVNVKNSTTDKYDEKSFQGFVPDVVIGIKIKGEKQVMCNGYTYAEEWASGPFRVFVIENSKAGD